jgi:DNA-directed RNA polymerase specialized sigma24 family protein
LNGGKEVAYNKARAEKEWLKWKAAEEAKLRELGVDEDTIQRLHYYDWESFKAERNYQRWNVQSEEYISQQITEDQPEITTTEQLLDEIESPELYTLLSKADKLTLKIVLYKLQGFTSLEIAQKTGLKETAVRQRISRLKKQF